MRRVRASVAVRLGVDSTVLCATSDGSLASLARLRRSLAAFSPVSYSNMKAAASHSGTTLAGGLTSARMALTDWAVIGVRAVRQREWRLARWVTRSLKAMAGDEAEGGVVEASVLLRLLVVASAAMLWSSSVLRAEYRHLRLRRANVLRIRGSDAGHKKASTMCSVV